jgi:hypothetical protein
MRLKKFFKGSIAVTLVALVSFGCADLSVDNLNDPNREIALNRPDDIVGLVQGGLEQYALYSMAYQTAPQMVQAGWYTSTVGNFWVNDAGTVPRTQYPNDPTAPFPMVTRFHWDRYNGSLANANLAIAAIDGGVIIENAGNTLAVKAAAQFLQGLTIGSLGLIFDKAFVIDENTDLTNQDAIDFLPYNEVIEAALEKMAAARATADQAAAAGSAGIPASLIPALGNIDSRNNAVGQMNWDQFKKVTYAYSASFLAQSPRSVQENQALDWNRVHSFASRGIDFDFAPQSDNGNWIPLMYLYTNAGWFRVHNDVVALMDPSNNCPWIATNDCTNRGIPNITDARFGVGKDYQHSPTWAIYNPARGLYKFSNVIYTRYIHFRSGAVWSDPIPMLSRAHNDLILAESELRRTGGSTANAVELINRYHVGRGGNTPVTAADNLVNALIYEFNVEVGPTGVAFLAPWYNARRWGKMISGSMVHLPVAFNELGALGVPYYSFGGGGDGSAPKTATLSRVLVRPQ